MNASTAAKKKKQKGELKEIDKRLAIIEKRTREAEERFKKSRDISEEIFDRKVRESIREGLEGNEKAERAKLLIRLYENYAGAFLSVPIEVRMELFEGNEKFQVLLLQRVLEQLKESKK